MPSPPPPPLVVANMPSPPPADTDGQAPPRVVQYFAQWAIYGRDFKPWEMELDQITHVNYAFFDVTQACAVASLDEYADFDVVFSELGMAWGDGKEHGNIGAFQILKERHPHLSVVLSLGGWTKSTHFSACAKSASKRQTLVASALSMLRRTGFDGLDLDWEYVSPPPRRRAPARPTHLCWPSPLARPADPVRVLPCSNSRPAAASTPTDTTLRTGTTTSSC